MGTTPQFAIPYVEPSDLLANYPTQDKAQAEKIEQLMQTDSRMWAEYRLTADQSLASATATTVNLSVIINEGGFTLAAGEITVPTAGVYLVAASVSFLSIAGATGNRYGYLFQNTTLALRQSIAVTPSVTLSIPLVKWIKFAAGDKLKMQAYHTQGAALALDSASNLTHLTIGKL